MKSFIFLSVVGFSFFLSPIPDPQSDHTESYYVSLTGYGRNKPGRVGTDQQIPSRLDLLSTPLNFEKYFSEKEYGVEYLARSTSGTMYFFSTKEVTMSLANGAERHSLKVRFPRSKSEPILVPHGKTGSKVNYFTSKNPERWRKNVSSYTSITYNNLYDGIDLVYYGNGRKLEYDFIVHPYADPGQIGVEYEGSTGPLKLDMNGNVIVPTSVGQITEIKPIAYQLDSGGRRSEVRVSWALEEGRLLKFDLGAYDLSIPLFIDPLVFSTYLGGSDQEYLVDGKRLAQDGSGNIYVAGYTYSSDYPTTAGAYDETFNGPPFDLYVTKFNPTGTALIYSTYLGGADDQTPNGSLLASLAVDSAGNAYLAGASTEPDYPTTGGTYDGGFNGGTWDVVVSKLNPTGDTLLYSTFIGGSSDEFGHGIDVDGEGNAYVTGVTGSSNFPITGGAFNDSLTGSTVFVTKLNPTGSALVYSTFLYEGYSGAISVDSTGYAYIIGGTCNSDYPTTSGAFDTTFNGSCDAFLTKLDSSGSSLIFSTLLGGTDNEGANGLFVDSAGNSYMVGVTNSSNFPTSTPAYDKTYNGTNDIFITKVNASGSALVYSTYLGKANNDYAYDVTVDAGGNAYLTGYTGSSNFPTTIGAYDVTHGGSWDEAIITKLNSSGTTLHYSTFLGTGTNNANAWNIILDDSGRGIILGVTGASDFPVTPGAYDSTLGGSSDMFLTKIDFRVPVTVLVRKTEDYDGILGTSSDRTFRRWGMSLYLDSIHVSTLVGSVTSAESLLVTNLEAGTYIAVEADSGGWNRIGKRINGLDLAWTAASDTFTLIGGQTRTVDFINYHPRILVRKFTDPDSSLGSDSGRASKKWNLRVYRDSVSGPSLVGEVASAESLSVFGLTSGIYIALEADSSGWFPIGKISDGTPSPGNSRADTFSYTAGTTYVVDFVNTHAILLRKYFATDGNFNNPAAWVPKKWSMTLYKNGAVSPGNIVPPTFSFPESLVYLSPPPNDYIAREADSTGWIHVGTVLDGVSLESQEREVEFTLSSGEAHVVSFVNASPNSVTIRKFADQDGSFLTTGDRTAKTWFLRLHDGPNESGTVLDSVNSATFLTVNGLPYGTYTAAEADSQDWTHISVVVDGVPQGGTTVRTWTFTVSSGQNRTIDFINFDTRRIKLWTPDSSNCDWSVGSNWLPPGVPIPGDTIIVDSNASCPLVIPPGASVGTISVADQETVYVNPGVLATTFDEALDIQRSRESQSAGYAFSVTGDLVVRGQLIVASEDTTIAIFVSGDWNVTGGFTPGKSTVLLPATGAQIVSQMAAGSSFYNLTIGETVLAGSELQTHALHASNVSTAGNFTVKNTLMLNAPIDAEGDTIFIDNSAPNALRGPGIVPTGTISRRIQSSSVARYRYESDSSYIRFDGTGTYPGSVAITAYPATSPWLFQETWVDVPSTVDTLDNIMRAENIAQFSRWRVRIPRPTGVSPLIERVYSIKAEGGTGFVATLSLRYDQSEVPFDLMEDSLTLSRSVDNVDQSPRWHLFSLPYADPGVPVSNTFPTAVSGAYYFLPSAGYAQSDTFHNGVGYWIKIPPSDLVGLSGDERLSDSVDVEAGWNLIGTLSQPVSVSSVTSSPGGILASPFYLFNGGYETAAVLEPMRGYWIKVTAPGKIILDSGTSIINPDGR